MTLSRPAAGLLSRQTFCNTFISPTRSEILR